MADVGGMLQKLISNRTEGNAAQSAPSSDESRSADAVPPVEAALVALKRDEPEPEEPAPDEAQVEGETEAEGEPVDGEEPAVAPEAAPADEVSELRAQLAYAQQQIGALMARQAPSAQPPPMEAPAWERLLPRESLPYGDDPHVRQAYQTVMRSPQGQQGAILKSMPADLQHRVAAYHDALTQRGLAMDEAGAAGLFRAFVPAIEAIVEDRVRTRLEPIARTQVTAAERDFWARHKITDPKDRAEVMRVFQELGQTNVEASVELWRRRRADGGQGDAAQRAARGKDERAVRQAARPARTNGRREGPAPRVGMKPTETLAEAFTRQLRLAQQGK